MQTLGLHARTGTGGNRAELFGRAGNLPDTAAYLPDELTEAQPHAVHRVQQLAQFVMSFLLHGFAQVASGNALRKRHGLP
ncbi:hypothetical protein D3C84_943970 [compost metagenome]